MQIVVEQLLNALQMGVLLFLIASGLSLVFGLMHVVNLAHGALYMVGAYFGITIARGVGSFYLALLLAPLLTAMLGVLLERTLLARTYGRGMYPQVLLTLGLVFAFDELVRIIWGAPIQTLALPQGLDGTVVVAGASVPVYRVLVVVVGTVVIDPPGPPGQAGRHRARGGIPRIAPGVLRHGAGAARQRRHAHVAARRKFSPSRGHGKCHNAPG